MGFHLLEELNGRHLERYRYVAVCVNEDDVVLPCGAQICPAVELNALDSLVVWQTEAVVGKVDYLFVYLNTGHFRVIKIAVALRGVRAAAHSENENGKLVLLANACHIGRGEGVIVIKTGESAVLFGYGLNSEEYVR